MENTRHDVSRQNGVAPIQSLQAANLRAALQRAAAKPNGLLIGDKLIQRITGPVSITILKPPSNPSFYMPPIIFFGDVHYSTQGECEACNVDDGCYRISEDAFYQVFDHVATDEAPIDVYTESYMKEVKPNYYINKNGELSRTIEYFRRCAAWTASEKKRFPQPSCPTQHIRYQYGDPRHARMPQDGGAIFEHLLSIMHNDPDTTKKLIMDTPHPIIRKIGQYIIDAFYEFGVYDMSKLAILPMKYSNIMYELLMKIPPSYSRIRKQLEKMPKGFDPESIKFLIYESILNLPNMSLLSRWMADVYLFLRLFKVPTEGLSPALAIMYFGNDHAVTFTYFLQIKFNYEVIYHDELTAEQWLHSKKNNIHTYARCLVINKHIDVNHLLHTSERQLKHHASVKKKRNMSLKKEKKGGSTLPSVFKKGGRTTKNKRRD